MTKVHYLDCFRVQHVSEVGELGWIKATTKLWLPKRKIVCKRQKFLSCNPILPKSLHGNVVAPVWLPLYPTRVFFSCWRFPQGKETFVSLVSEKPQQLQQVNLDLLQWHCWCKTMLIHAARSGPGGRFEWYNIHRQSCPPPRPNPLSVLQYKQEVGGVFSACNSSLKLQGAMQRESQAPRRPRVTPQVSSQCPSFPSSSMIVLLSPSLYLDFENHGLSRFLHTGYGLLNGIFFLTIGA